MVIAKGRRGDRHLVVVGVSRDSLRELMAGLPIRVDSRHPGADAFDVEIVPGVSDRALGDMLAQPGALGADTVIVSVVRDEV